MTDEEGRTKSETLMTKRMRQRDNDMTAKVDAVFGFHVSSLIHASSFSR